jgi:hypothetical protein
MNKEAQDLLPTLESLTGDLDFTFGESIDQAGNYYSKTRALNHRQFNSSQSQISFVANCLKLTLSLLESQTSTPQPDLNIAVVFPDILPLDGEFAGKQLLSLLFRLDIISPENILLISTRNNIRGLLGPEFKDCSVSDRINESMDEYALIIFTSSSLYLGLSIEPIRSIRFNTGTILMTTNTTLSPSKILQMFAPNTVIPFYPAEHLPNEYYDGRDQGSTWNNKQMKPGFVLPDLGIHGI